MQDSIHKRGQALENNFFKKLDQQLLENMRSEMAAKESRAALQAVSGIQDTNALDALVNVGVTPESLTSVALIPVVAVAWADNKMEDKERTAILKAAAEFGLSEGTSAYSTLESWLSEKPDDDLFETWKGYIAALKESVDDAAYSQVKSNVVKRSWDVAAAAGGFLGIATVSASEEAVLKSIEAAF